MHNIGYCGNHCTYCFFTECRGCKSENPCCSYANLFEDGRCPNTVCCEERKLNGCWECEHLEDCGLGFFSSGENDAKAYALFIRTYECELYTKTVETLMDKGYDYPKQFKQINQVQEILKIFENEVQNES